jgi:hypothetical protein
VTCKSGFGLADDNCYACLIQKCKDCDGHPKKCKKCKLYHYYDEQKELCSRCNFGCEQCMDTKVCIRCGLLFQMNKTDKEVGKCSLSIIMSIGILIGLIIPCILVWGLTYYLCLRTKPLKYDDQGMPIVPVVRRRNRADRRNNASPVKVSLKGKIKDFLYVSTGLDGNN